jgi:hypothetical protein
MTYTQQNNIYKEYKMTKYFIIFIFIILSGFSFCLAQNLQIIDGWYYIDGEKFFIKGIGYETHTRPGQVPWIYSFDSDLIEFDLNRIKNAGFNTIRTWSALKEEELIIVEDSGLKILFGIWIDPYGDFNNQNFRIEAYNHVNDILNYSAKYHSIIGYLIMNEPQVQHIYDKSAQALSDLWNNIIDLIHDKHSGIPVSFSNTIIGDYIDMEIFDFAAFNAYIYNPVTISKSHGYSGYLHFLKQNRAAQMPFIITEYGLSVSPGSPNDEYGYGGNSLEQQTSGDLFMYRGLIDAGAQGNCIFQYHDGWWKSGNEHSHDPGPEEWFGLIEFSGSEDKYGTPRPVWAAYEKYNKAIITNPKNGYIYQENIPIEFFATSEAVSYSIRENGNHLILEQLDSTHYRSELILTSNEKIKDIELAFDFLNAANDTIKSEIISILYSDTELVLPEIKLELSPENIIPGSLSNLKMHVNTNPLFSIKDNKIDFVFHPHIGFDEGIAKSKVMSFIDNEWSYQSNFYVPPETKAATFGAGFTITYGRFTKRIVNQKIVIYGDWADPIAAPELVTGISPLYSESADEKPIAKLFQNYPNPFNPGTTFQFYISKPGIVRLYIYNIRGQEITSIKRVYDTQGKKEIYWNSETIPSGLYFYCLNVNNRLITKKMIIYH